MGLPLSLSQGTQPDLCVMASNIDKYTNNSSPGNILAAKNAIKYIKDTQLLGISFRNTQQLTVKNFVHFTIDSI